MSETSQPAETTDGETEAKKKTNWRDEAKGIFWLVLAVLGFHSFVAKPFYIPSESMMPGLLKGDRLVVSKYPYGWSWVSPSFHVFPPTQGRIFGSLPQRGDVVIVTPPGAKVDYIKRVIGLPGDTLEMIQGQLFINGEPVKRERRPDTLIPVDANVPCLPDRFADARAPGPDGQLYCRMPVVRETLPGGATYDTIDRGYTEADDFAALTVPANHLFLMGDNRDNSSDSRFPTSMGGLGGPVPWENIGGRAEFITFSLDGTSQILNPISWFTALRGGRAGDSLHPERPEGN
ncbi:signal peptidase I [Allosphingosinicella flava]|uniref:Signal peptidase I n=1 Tax=Allosphingosinicella flava TaxID=2771430 RepID=A0A7T2LLD3_9SPHN|nr:signal peptidase I [Sphingosinicella flava]QPQ54400.1 signal peptidase I [Sphingosinicella flava]